MNSDFRELGGLDPHALLGVRRGVGAQEVTRAFRRKVRAGGHPDTGGDERGFRTLARARDILLDPARAAAYDAAMRAAQATRLYTRPASPRQPTPPSQASPPNRSAPPKPDVAPAPQKTSRMAIATVVLALLGPLVWPVAIVVGHLALRRIKRTGEQGDALVAVVLVLLYILSILVLPRILLVPLIP